METNINVMNKKDVAISAFIDLTNCGSSYICQNCESERNIAFGLKFIGFLKNKRE